METDGQNGNVKEGQRSDTAVQLDRFVYNDAIVRAFLLITVLWGFVALLVGIVWPRCSSRCRQ
jgi:hypothetical protein